MAPPDDSDSRKLVEMALKLLDTDILIAAYQRKEIEDEDIIKELAWRYQKGIGSAVSALGEINKDVARQLGERLRSRMDSLIKELAERDDDKPDKQVKTKAGIVGRDDAVLLREYIILRVVDRSNGEVRSAHIFDAVRSWNSSIPDEHITAHLARLVKGRVIVREGKGMFTKTARTADHLARLTDVIDRRKINLPVVPETPAD